MRLSQVVLVAFVALLGCAKPAPSSGPTIQAGNWWSPAVGVSWQWQLAGSIDTSVAANVYDVDLFETNASVVDQLHQQGRKVICYLNAGAFENFRPDAATYPQQVLGTPLDGWEGERWLDIRRTDLLEPILVARLDLCKMKGFDAVEPDNVDGYTDDSGFPLKAEDQLRFNRMIARLAHERQLGVALKNDLDQVPQLVGDFDFAVNEQCVEHKECGTLKPFIRAGKAVLHAEYRVPPAEFCPQTVPLHFSSIGKQRELTKARDVCP